MVFKQMVFAALFAVFKPLCNYKVYACPIFNFFYIKLSSYYEEYGNTKYGNTKGLVKVFSQILDRPPDACFVQ